MDRFIDERDLKLLSGDRHTFAVLSRILREPCELVLSDHARLILCHSEPRYPIWLWTPDDAAPEEVARAWAMLTRARSPEVGFRCNLKRPLAERFLNLARAQGVRADIIMRLCAYECTAPLPPAVPADGAPYRCGEEDVEEIASLLERFNPAVGEAPLGKALSEQHARDYVETGAFYLWKDAAGTTVACCGCRAPVDGLARIGPVYTLPEHRRRHYAQSLVHHATCAALAAGWAVMLYTNGDYAASNACYRGIGYELKGELCTLAVYKEAQA